MYLDLIFFAQFEKIEYFDKIPMKKNDICSNLNVTGSINGQYKHDKKNRSF